MKNLTETVQARVREHRILAQLAAELGAAGHPVDAGQLRWVVDEFQRRRLEETTTRAIRAAVGR